MATELSFAAHLAAIAGQAALFADDAAQLDLPAAVPTCPRWSAGDLVAHLGTVHRWATAHAHGVRGQGPQQAAKAAAAEVPDLMADRIGWLRQGATALVAALQAAPDDLRAMVFLRDPPPPREFWARRQAHETTMHRADAVAARLGRRPLSTELDLGPAFAVDGIDELLTGFLPRGSSRLRSDVPVVVTVAPTDADRAWTIRISTEPPDCRPGADPAADAQFTGSAVGLYLGLWNRGNEISATGRPDVLALWRRTMRVRWS